MRSPFLKAFALAILLCAISSAQVTTLSQSTNGTTITAGNSIACAAGNPPQFTVDNGYFRSYSLTAIGASIDIVSIRFGVEQVATTAAAGLPVIIRLHNDPSGGAPSPYSSLVLRHTETFTLPVTTVPTVITQPMTGPTTTFASTETLVVELFTPSGVVAGNIFFIGSNALGQTAPGYLRAPACGAAFNDPASLATSGFPNMHIILDVNYSLSGQTVTFPGTNEDLTLFTAVNANPLTTGIGNSTKNVVAADNLTVKVSSTGSTFNFREFVLIGQGYATGFPPFPPVAPNIHLGIGLVPIIGGVAGPLGPVLLPPGGITVVFTVPPGLTGSSALLQGVVITWTAPFAGNGLYAATDAHEINIL